MVESNGDVAIVGMSCRVAGANSPSELWDLLASSKDVQSEITRFNAEGYYHSNGGPLKGLTNVRAAYMLNDDVIDRFDHAFFHTTPLEAIAMDPQQRMLLEVAYEAVENAGMPLEGFVGTDTAVFTGMDSCDYHLVLARDIDATPRYLATGTAACMTANRISYFFNLSGPSIAMDTACSSTMTALSQAVDAIKLGDSKMALVCGAKLIINPDMFIPSSELCFLSPSGRCRSFDAAGDGYGRGEGVLAILIKPLEMAVADNDPIRAVIKGTRLNQDGRTQGITLPSAKAQKCNMETLYGRIGIAPSDIQYVEAHGTGTAAGDPLEFSAIKAVFDRSHKENPLIVGSIKSNIGHLESAAALASIIKTVECLERGKIPAQMHFNNPNPKIDFNNTHVPVCMIDWPKSGCGVRRAGVNTFGAGGTNGHLVLESYSRSESQEPCTPRPWLYKVSGVDSAAVKRLSLKYSDYIETRTPDLQELAYTLLTRRSALQESFYFTAGTVEEAATKLRTTTPKPQTRPNTATKKVVFLFTGQGSQWPQMGKALLDHSPIFKAVLIRCEGVLAGLPDKPSWSLTQELSRASDTSNVYRCAFSQPLCTALQIGLVALWRSWGLEADIVLGHSSGEIAAAYSAGFVSLQDAMIIAYYRGLYLSRSISGPGGMVKGGMCAIGANEEDARAILSNYGEEVQLAAVNSPTSCTLSGDVEAIKSIIRFCKENGIFCRELRVDIAYHSHHMLPVAPLYAKALNHAGIPREASVANCTMYSSVTGHNLTFEGCNIDYWVQNMVSTVQLYSAFTTCINEHADLSLIVEVGPHPALKGPSQEILQRLGRDPLDYFHSCYRGKNDLKCLLDNAGAMLLCGVSLETATINSTEVMDGSRITEHVGNVLTDLPTYQWNHSTPFWTESRSSRNLRYRQFRRHQLLGARCAEDTPLCPSWRNLLMLKEISWLAELKNRGVAVVPPAIFILMALEAARQTQIAIQPDAPFVEVKNLTLESTLQLSLFASIETIVEIHLNASKIKSTDVYEFEVLSATTGEKCNSIRLCKGQWATSTASYPNTPELYIAHDPFLLQNLRELNPDWSGKLKNLSLSSMGAIGRFDSSEDKNEHYFVDPEVLEDLINLPSVALLSQNLAAAYRISSIASIVVPAVKSTVSNGKFRMKANRLHPYGVHSDIYIELGLGTVSIAGINIEASQSVNAKPALSSLFYKPVMLPDITRMVEVESMDLSRCLELITHKWPMSDIAIADIGERDLRYILDTLPGVRIEQRPRFRSLRTLGEATESHSTHVTFVEDLDESDSYHILFIGGSDPSEQMAIKLIPNGLMFVRGVEGLNMTQLSESFHRVCKVTGLSTDDWTLWHAFGNAARVHQKSTRVFASPQSLTLVDYFEATEHVPLEPQSVAKFCQQAASERFETVVIDNTEKSVILDWTGDELVPWLQFLLTSSKSIIWISRHLSNNPFTNVTGSLLRTIQSEQPLIKVAWLVFTGGETDSFIRETIISTSTAMMNGENEVILHHTDSQPRILRYLPDGELSASTGVILPIKYSGPIIGRNYELSLCAPQEPVLLSFNRDFHIPTANTVLVQVEASILDLDDLAAFAGPPLQNPSIERRLSLGRFFGGKTLIGSTKHGLPAGSEVVGWHSGVHSNVVEAPEGNLLCGRDSQDAAASVLEFAVLATALSIVDGVVRARTGDTFRLQLTGVLEEGIARVCRDAGALVLEKKAGATSLPIADFVVTFEPEKGHGLLVNGKAVDIGAYLSSRHGWKIVESAWNASKCGCSHRFPLLSISKTKDAFEMALSKKDPFYPVVLTHSDPEKITNTVLTYQKPSKLFSSEGAYILVGGLGGLGRFVSKWMIANGARYLVSISRSGLNSSEAQETYDAINAPTSTNSMTVITADACSRSAMSTALSQVREKRPIKGVLNMAMLLGDAPLSSMAGWQWDRALYLKVDSSWLLHELTLEASDPLDFFIMFSSIASVLGNRNQGGYNLGNAFLNALCDYRRSIGLTGISIALGAMVDIGILHQLSNPHLLPTLARSGLTPLQTHHLEKILEAAVVESRRPTERSMILTGLEMFERVDGKMKGPGVREGEGIYWTECAEFGFLQEHILSRSGASEKGKADLKAKVTTLSEEKKDKEAFEVLMNGFLTFLAGLLGFDVSIFNPASSLAMYGLDSLSGVSCQYWFYRELSTDVSVSAILNAPSIAGLIKDAHAKIVSAGRNSRGGEEVKMGEEKSVA